MQLMNLTSWCNVVQFTSQRHSRLRHATASPVLHYIILASVQVELKLKQEGTSPRCRYRLGRVAGLDQATSTYPSLLDPNNCPLAATEPVVPGGSETVFLRKERHVVACLPRVHVLNFTNSASITEKDVFSVVYIGITIQHLIIIIIIIISLNYQR
jgi:hypothetical protein